MSTFIETFTGRRFQPLAPQDDDLDIRDVAHHLSNQCRFSGAVRHFYSVAEHSVRVSEHLAELGASTLEQLDGLLHDGSEAYLVDMVTPLKTHPVVGKSYRKAEDTLMSVVRTHYRLPAIEPAIVRHADRVLLATEVRDLMPNREPHWGSIAGVECVSRRIRPWSPAVAEYEFLRRYFELMGG